MYTVINILFRYGIGQDKASFNNPVALGSGRNLLRVGGLQRETAQQNCSE